MRIAKPLLVAFGTLGLAAPAHAPRVDLDVGIPPGSPVTWGRRFPAITPARGPVFPVTQAKGAVPGGTVAKMARTDLDLRVSTSFGVVRILTWDLMAHLPWVKGFPAELGPVTGASAREAGMPAPGSGLYWATMASFLRLLLHPQLVSETELMAHLLEVGEPVLGVLDAVASEKALEPVVQRLRADLQTRRRGFVPLPGKTPRDTMLRRWIAEELVAVHPYDPEAGFGQRLFMFAEEVEPHLALYVQHRDSFLRRNATAALSRFESATAISTLMATAADTEDLVVLMRALSALGSTGVLGDPEPLVQRLARCKDPVEEAALIQAAGRAGLARAVPMLLSTGKKALSKADSDRLQAVLSALVRLPAGGEREQVIDFAEDVERAAAATPNKFSVQLEPSAPRADIPDTEGMRGEVIRQLALLVLARHGGADKHEDRLLGLLDPSGGAPSSRATNSGFGRVHPPAMMLFIEGLPWMGRKGLRALEKLATDTTLEALLRGAVLGRMPVDRRGEIAIQWVEDVEQDPELAIYGLDQLGRDGHTEVDEIARKLLETAAKKPTTAPIPATHRYLWLRALAILEQRRSLDSAQILPLMKLVEQSALAMDALSIRARRLVEQMIARLVDKAATDLRKVTGSDVEEILDAVLSDRLNPRITEERRRDHRDAIGRFLQGLPGHRADTNYKQTIENEIKRYVLGVDATPRGSDRSQFEPVVLLEAEILTTLGRSGTPEAIEALAAFLHGHPTNPHRGHACLAAGMTGSRSLAKHLVPRLLDEDPFVRFCAYEALRHLTGQDFWADWMYGDASARGAAASQYFEWCTKNK